MLICFLLVNQKSCSSIVCSQGSVDSILFLAKQYSDCFICFKKLLLRHNCFQDFWNHLYGNLPYQIVSICICSQLLPRIDHRYVYHKTVTIAGQQDIKENMHVVFIKELRFQHCFQCRCQLQICRILIFVTRHNVQVHLLRILVIVYSTVIVFFYFGQVQCTHLVFSKLLFLG